MTDKIKIPKDGFVNLSDEDYRALPCANYSAVKTLCLGGTPAHYKAKQEGDDSDSKSKSFGRLAHSALLEPDVFKNIEKLPDNIKQRSGAEYFYLLEEYPATTFLPPGEWAKFEKERDVACRVRDSVLNHPVAGPLLDNVRTEVPMVWTHKESKLKCKGKIDALDFNLKYIADIKTTSKFIPYQTLRSGYYFGYHIQCAMYCDGVAALTKRSGQEIPFYFIFVEVEPPYLVLVADGHTAFDERTDESDPYGFYKLGKEQYEYALQKIADCTAKNEWEGHPLELQEMVINKWAGIEGVYF